MSVFSMQEWVEIEMVHTTEFHKIWSIDLNEIKLPIGKMTKFVELYGVNIVEARIT